MENKAATIDSRPTAFWAIGLLFFIQLFTLFVESIYRISLIKLSMGGEMLGVLFLLGPLLLLVIPSRFQPAVEMLAIAGLVLARLAAPFVGVSAQIVAAGGGVACFLVLIARAQTKPMPEINWGESLAAAAFISIVLRSYRPLTIDATMLGSAWPLGSILIIVLLLRMMWENLESKEQKTESETAPTDAPLRIVFTRTLSSFSTLTFVILLVASPGVITAWSGVNYWWAVAISLFGWMGAPLLLPRWVPQWHFLALWNFVFVFSLVGGIMANRVAFPALSESTPVIAGPDTWWQRAPLYLALALSPVLVWNFSLAFRDTRRASVGVAAIATFVGILTLFLITLLLIFSNVWGYVGPVSHAMRNGFHIPFIVAGVIMIIALCLLGNRVSQLPQATIANQKYSALIFILCGFGILTLIPNNEGSATVPNTVTELTIVTYNMQQGSELNGNQRYWDQAKFIAKKNPDIVFLQESDTTRPSGGNVNGPKVIANELGFHLYYGPKTVTGTFGTAILSRFPLENTRTIYTYSDADEVGTAIAEIVVNGKRITLFCNHPAGSDPVMNAHADMLVSEAKKCENVIAAGDFNSRPDEEPFKRIAAALTDSWSAVQPQPVLAGPEGSKWLDPNRRIDHVFFSSGFGVKEVEYTLPPASITDHPAYRCVLTFK